ncbi:MAG: BON domain-containing protein [Nitrospirae bacterium]|nr:BON domain-containing protein [Nitrospirota bacterium]
MKQVLVIVFMLLFVSGHLVGCRTMTGKTAGEIVDDSAIVAQINAKIVKDPDLKFFSIDVDSTRGNVVLGGIVTTKEAEETLIKIAEGVAGVKSVTSNLEVKK